MARHTPVSGSAAPDPPLDAGRSVHLAHLRLPTWARVRDCAFRDPSGNMIRLSEPARPR